MCSTDPFQYRWLKGYVYSSCYYHHQIESINLSHCYHIFPWYCLRCLLHHILLLIAYKFRENREFVFIIIVQFMMSANSQIRFDLKIVLVYFHITPSHYHHCASLSEDIELIKCLSDIVCRVYEYDRAYSLSYPLQNTWGCVFPVDPFPLWWLREYICTLSYYHHQVGSLNYHQLVRVRSWNNGVRCMSFCILTDQVNDGVTVWPPSLSPLYSCSDTRAHDKVMHISVNEWLSMAVSS